jgi:hypothetical protein
MDESTDFLHFLACSIDVVALVVGQVAKPLELHEQIANFTYPFFCLPSCHHHPILHPERNTRAAKCLPARRIRSLNVLSSNEVRAGVRVLLRSEAL